MANKKGSGSGPKPFVRKDFEYIFPVIGIEFYRNGWAVIKRARTKIVQHGDAVKREIVTFLSPRSMKRLAFVASATGVRFNSMMTLTYGKNWPKDGKTAKKHLNAFLTWYRREVSNDYLWFLEFQKRGAPHFHILSTKRMDNGWKSELARRNMAHAWAKIVLGNSHYQYCEIVSRETFSVWVEMYNVHNHPKSWAPIRSENGAARYVVKYATKLKQKDVPANYRNVGRFFGWSTRVKKSIKKICDFSVTGEEVRAMLRAIDHPAKDSEVLPRFLFGVDTPNITFFDDNIELV